MPELALARMHITHQGIDAAMHQIYPQVDRHLKISGVQQLLRTTAADQLRVPGTKILIGDVPLWMSPACLIPLCNTSRSDS